MRNKGKCRAEVRETCAEDLLLRCAGFIVICWGFPRFGTLALEGGECGHVIECGRWNTAKQPAPALRSSRQLLQGARAVSYGQDSSVPGPAGNSANAMSTLGRPLQGGAIVLWRTWHVDPAYGPWFSKELKHLLNSTSTAQCPQAVRTALVTFFWDMRGVENSAGTFYWKLYICLWTRN